MCLPQLNLDCLNGLLLQNDERMNHGSVYDGNLQIC